MCFVPVYSPHVYLVSEETNNSMSLICLKMQSRCGGKLITRIFFEMKKVLCRERERERVSCWILFLCLLKIITIIGIFFPCIAIKRDVTGVRSGCTNLFMVITLKLSGLLELKWIGKALLEFLSGNLNFVWIVYGMFSLTTINIQKAFGCFSVAQAM